MTTEPLVSSQTVIAAAEALHAALSHSDAEVGEISTSVGRVGTSCYFYLAYAGGQTRVRVSDHHANPDYRVHETHIHFRAPAADAAATAENLLAAMTAAATSAARKLDAENSARDAKEAPFKARWQAAAPHERGKIIIECYPAAADNKAMRREIAARWSK